MNRTTVVVLGAAVLADGNPSGAMRRRVEHAVALWREEPGALLVFTGGRGIHGPPEAEVMAALAREAGVAPEDIELERHATNTGESARLVGRLLRPRGVRRVVLVTDGYHCRRTRLAFRRMGFEASASAVSTPDVSTRLRVRLVLREAVGLAWYGLTFR